MHGKPADILENITNQQVTQNLRENNVDSSLRGISENKGATCKNAGRVD
jgi:hypothetical protein